MNYRIRYFIFFVLDSLSALSAVFIGYWLFNPSFNINHTFIISAISLILCYQILANLLHLSTRIWSGASVRDLLPVGFATTISVIVTSLCQLFIQGSVDFGEILIIWLILQVLFVGCRVILRIFHEVKATKRSGKLKRVLVVGAGEAGTILLRSIQRNQIHEYEVVAIVDDNQNKQHLSLWGIKVCGTTEDIPRIAQEKDIDIIFLAIPSLGKIQLRRIYELCKKTKAQITQKT